MNSSNLWRCLTLALAVMLAPACGLLEVSDPTVVEEADIANPDGAELMRRYAVSQLYDALGYATLYGGLITDELIAFPSKTVIQTASIWAEHVLDSRGRDELVTGPWAASTGYPYSTYQSTRTAASNAINWFRDYGVAAQRAHLGQMYAVRGYAILGLAEQVCPGFALHEVDRNYRVVFGKPLTTEEAFARALVDFDSAVVHTADSADYLYFSQIGKARALLGLGRFGDAAAAVASVPTEFEYNVAYGADYRPANRLYFFFSATGNNLSVADREGGNGLDFISANDPRVPVAPLGIAHDGVTELYASARYNGTTNIPMPIASGIEARLIEAEAALNDDDPAWIDILNDLRATQVDPALAPLADPGTPDARIDLLFRERAFWLFLNGRRLGDMRRLIDIYGRDANSVFPSGPYHIGGNYEGATSLPFAPTHEEHAGTGVSGCTG